MCLELRVMKHYNMLYVCVHTTTSEAIWKDLLMLLYKVTELLTDQINHLPSDLKKDAVCPHVDTIRYVANALHFI